MTCEEIETAIKSKVALIPSLGVKFKFDFGEDGLVFVDGTQNPAIISREDAPADTTVICSKEVFQSILNGTQDPTMAFMMGKVKIQGAMGNALKLSALLES